jgi:hypothetical protein
MTGDVPAGQTRGSGLVVAFALSAAVIVLFALAPLISAMLASVIANANGCALDEGGVHPCLMGGADYGEMLSVMFVSAWFGLVTLPIGALAAILWCMVLCIVVFVKYRRKKS